MSASPPLGLTDEEVERLLNGDNEPQQHVQEPATVADAIDTAFQALSQVTGASQQNPNADGSQPTGDAVRAIWGSSLEVSHVMTRVFSFARSFRKDGDSAQSEAYYIRIIGQIYEQQISYLNLDMQNVRAFDVELYESVVSYPQETIPIFDAVFSQIYKSLFMNDDNQELMEGLVIETRPFNLPPKPMRDLDPEDIDTLVTIRGMIIRTSSVMPDMQAGFFECSECKETVTSRIQDGRILEPSKCPRCDMRDCMALVHNRCVYIDKQFVKLQEAPDTVPEGATPQTVQLATHDALVDYCKPGDKVLATGIFRASQVRNASKESNIRQLFKTYLDVVHFKRTERGTLSGSATAKNASSEEEGTSSEAAEARAIVDGIRTSNTADGPETQRMEGNIESGSNDRDEDEVDAVEKDREEEFRRLASRPDIYDILVRSLAPSIWEMEDVKRGILCQLFGGSSKTFAQQTIGKFRSEINVLLCGDPGTSKSQLLQYVHKLAPRGIYTSGKGSSAVGLTAYITKDEDTGEAVLESGALTLSDRGICCIDEFDKMSDATRSILHEAMEQQTVSVAKAGIIATLNARTSILASANPRESRYNKKLSVVENIQLPPTLLSRFDLIYLVLDNPQRESDARLARHIISMYSKERMQGVPKKASTTDSRSNGSRSHQTLKTNEEGRSAHMGSFGVSTADDDIGEVQEPPAARDGPVVLSTETLRKYIAFSKRVCTPQLSDEAGAALVKGYVAMRRKGASQNTITATTRQLESLIRLSESLAKMKLAPLVMVEDVNEAIRLMEVATYQSAMDPLTGRLDMDLINTGRGAAHELFLKNLAQQLTDIIRQYRTETIQEDQLFGTLAALSSDPVSQPDFLEALHMLQEESVISISGLGRARLIRYLEG